MAEVALRQKTIIGGWWNRPGLQGIEDGYPEDVPVEDDGLDPNDPVLHGPGSADPTYTELDPLAAILQYGKDHPGDIGPASQPSAASIANNIAQFATLGIKAVAPIAGGCPAGYTRSASACVPGSTPIALPGAAAGQAAGQLVPGVSNQTLILIGLGFIALSMMGGRKR